MVRGLFIAGLWCASVWGAAPLLPDGTTLNSVPGKVRLNRGTWFFVPREDLVEAQVRVAQGTPLEILPSPGLGPLVADVRGRSERTYRVWAQVTQYRGRNYLWISRFTFASDSSGGPEPNTVGKDPGRPGEAGPVGIPMDVIREVESYKPVQKGAAGPATRPASQGRAYFLSRTGFLAQGMRGPAFAPDGLGLQVEGRSYEILPCKALEGMEDLQARQSAPVRMDVAGMVIPWQGRAYLLPLRAVRAYGFGNFNR